MLYKGNEPYMPPNSLPPGDPNYNNKGKIKIRGADDYGSEGVIYIDVTVRKRSGENQSLILCQLCITFATYKVE